jgi:hypothetical protein
MSYSVTHVPNPYGLTVPLGTRFRAWLQSPTTMFGFCLIFVTSWNMFHQIWTVNFSWPYIAISVFLILVPDNTYTHVIRNRLIEIIADNLERLNNLPPTERIALDKLTAKN